MSLSSPFPPIYKFIFAVAEPGGLLAGAAFAIFLPRTFFNAYLGSGWLGDSTTGGIVGDSGVLTASGMGSCMCIIGVLSLVVLPTLSRTLKAHPEIHEKILNSYLGALAVGDVAHILVTLIYAPAAVRWHPSTWTILLWGNIVGTALPAVARIAWFSGLGRTSYGAGAAQKLKGKARAAGRAGYGTVNNDASSD